MKADQTTPGRRYTRPGIDPRPITRMLTYNWLASHLIAFRDEDELRCYPVDLDGFELIKERYSELETGDMFKVGPNTYIKTEKTAIRKDHYEAFYFTCPACIFKPDLRIEYLGRYKAGG